MSTYRTYDDLATAAENGQLTPIPGTALHGQDATEQARALLMRATGASTPKRPHASPWDAPASESAATPANGACAQRPTSTPH